nr:hypothetical protein [Rhodococcus sp. (in: high G+C Gram-positive bacteria)]
MRNESRSSEKLTLLEDEMPKDNRTFITITVDMPRHPNYAELTKGQKFVLIEAWCHCREYKTDGFVSKVVWNGLATKRDRIAIESLKGVEVIESPPGIQFTDYLEHQQSKAEIDEAVEKARSAGRKGGLTRAENARKAQADAQAPAKQPLKQNPRVVQAEEEEELEESTDVLSKRARTRTPTQRQELFDRFWVCYPRKSGRKAAQTKFEIAIRDNDPELIIEAAKRYAEDPNREDQFTAMPTTWLNQGRYLDESPLPQRSSIQTASQRGMAYMSHLEKNPPPNSPPPAAIDPFAPLSIEAAS